MLLIVYNKKFCEEIILPNVYHSEYSVAFTKERFSVNSNFSMKFESRTDGWFLCSTEKYTVGMEQKKVSEHCLKHGDIVTVHTEDDTYYLVASDYEPDFPVMKKFDLRRVSFITIGRNEENAICFDFHGLISSMHGHFEQRQGAWYIVDNSANGIFVNHKRINRAQQLRFGDSIHIFGLHMLFMGNILVVHANIGNLKINVLPVIALNPVDHESNGRKAVQYFNRSPRNFPQLFEDKIDIEEPPAPRIVKEKPTYMIIGPAFTMAIPMTVGFMISAVASQMKGSGSGAFMYTGLITALGSAIIGGVWAVLNLNYSKKEATEDETKRFNAYSNYLIEITESIRKKYQTNAASLNYLYPSVQQILKYNGSSNDLWNRNEYHDDFLEARIGVGDIPFQSEIAIPRKKFSVQKDTLASKPEQIKNEFSTLHNAPISVNLKSHGIVGLAGGGDIKTNLMRVISAQLAASHSYTDVKFVYLFDETKEDWSSLRWYPHVWSSDHETRYFAGNEIERREILQEITRIMTARAEGQEGARPYYVLFVSDPEMLNDEPITKYLYENAPSSAITACILTEHASYLPNECTYIVSANEGGGVIYETAGQNTVRTQFMMDYISPADTEEFGKKLSTIRIKEVETKSEIPTSLTFFEMYHARKLADFDIASRWRRNLTYESLKALIGVKDKNNECYLDIHEKYHGPHGLVAGTTGSGKSELLQTYMLSLAVNYSPEDVAFFIIDFKGAGMANLFKDLPHVAGVISNLSGNQIQRAMISIKSENTRRQRLFAKYGVNHIDLYTKLYKKRKATERIPHLFIVIDEFAELKREQPEFMSELISVAQVGRSLGVHLILATQRPNGTVDDNIRSNSRFHLCLRVQDKQDSIDMLHRPDAAFLTGAGRCYMQIGNDEIFDLLQSGYSGAIYTENAQESYTTKLVNRIGKPIVVPSRDTASEESTDSKTQLDALVQYIKAVAILNGYDKSPALWLPPLGDEIYLDQISAESEKTDDIVVPIGLYDDPHNQIQKPLLLNFSEEGHLALCGMAVSGKSTFLQTLTYSLIQKYTPEEVNLYLLDYSSNKLSAFEGAPHVGGFMNEETEERLEKFFHFMEGILNERKKLFLGGSYKQYRTKEGKRLPAVFVIIDNYENFKEKTNDKYEELILRMSKEGISRGVYLVMSASGFGLNAIPMRIGANFRMIISLEQQDKFKYMDLLHISHLDLLPENNVHGRGLASVDGEVMEFQTALSLHAEDDFQMGEALKEECQKMNEEWKGEHAKKIPEIPENPTLAVFVSTDDYKAAIQTAHTFPYAYRSDDASVHSLNIKENYSYIFYGKNGSGKINAMRILMKSAYEKQAKIAVIEKTAPVMKLKKVTESVQAEYINDSKQLFEYFKNSLIPEFKQRNQKKNAMLEDGLSEEEIAVEMLKEIPILIFVRNMKDFMDMIYHPEDGVGTMNGFVENISQKGKYHNISFIFDLNEEDASKLMGYRAYNYFTSYRCGAFLGGNLSTQKVFAFQNLSLASKNSSLKKGYAYATDEEDNAISIVIPLAKGDL